MNFIMNFKEYAETLPMDMEMFAKVDTVVLEELGKYPDDLEKAVHEIKLICETDYPTFITYTILLAVQERAKKVIGFIQETNPMAFMIYMMAVQNYEHTGCIETYNHYLDMIKEYLDIVTGDMDNKRNS